MRKTITPPFLGLIFFLLFWVNLPPLLSDKLRASFSSPFAKRALEIQSDDHSRLELENRTLRLQIDQAYDWLSFHQKMLDQLSDKEYLQKRSSHVKQRLKDLLLSIPAPVIYRDPSLWSSSIWILVGEKTNQMFGKKVVGKNSPVIADGALVGVVEFVGENQSRVRLITDSGLCPSVRVCRGSFQNRELAHHLDATLKLLEKRDDLKKESFLCELQNLKKEIGISWEDGYLAKGELRGSSTPFWRSRSPLLKGIGFNYDFPDGMGEEKSPLIIKEGDLLVTTGLDGVFPQGLLVGTVTHVKRDQLGSYCYEIKLPAT